MVSKANRNDRLIRLTKPVSDLLLQLDCAHGHSMHNIAKLPRRTLEEGWFESWRTTVTCYLQLASSFVSYEE